MALRRVRVRAATLALLLAHATPGRAQPPTEPGISQMPTAAPRVEVVICESHDRALAHWVRAALAGKIPERGVTVVHFDAHPDLAAPSAPVARDWPPQPGRLMSSVDISSFQLAAGRIGLVDRVVWVRPSWATQLPDGERRFQVGLAEGAVRVDDESDYYVLDGGWSPSATLRDAVPVEVRVLPLEAAVRELQLADGPTIFDIDLDGFATRSPAADRLRASGLRDVEIARIRAMFAPESLGLADDPVTRIEQIEALTSAVEALGALRILELPRALYTLFERGLGLGDLYALYRILGKADTSASIDVLLEDGRQVVGLPEHRAGKAGFARTAAALADLLRSGSVQPVLITIARSARDGFTPPESVRAIEAVLSRELADALGDFELRYDEDVSDLPAAAQAPTQSRAP